MQIVIEIDNSIYDICRSVRNLPLDENDIMSSLIMKSIANGTPLPKGHGRLIDADSIYQIVRPIEQGDAEWGMTAETAIRLMHDVFNRAPTIIEADKGDRNEY